jgi:hypothetical protein
MTLTRTVLTVVAALAVLAAAALAFIYWYDRTGQRPDGAFDATVSVPAYGPHAKFHPRLGFDVAHRNWHTPSGRYRPLAELLRHDGYEVVEVNRAATPAGLTGLRVFVIANALGPSGHEHWDAFTLPEDSALVQWVRDGGALLLIADHAPFGAAAASLARAFGVEMYLAFARDDEEHAGWDNEKLVFSRTNGLLADHPIIRGRTPAERIERVVTFTGQSLSVPAGGTPVLRLREAAYDWKSRKVRSSARGHAQAIAMPFGKGRVVMLGEAGVLSAQVDPLGMKMGMNASGNDDRQFALNVFHWLSGALP